MGPVAKTGIRYVLILIDSYTRWLECCTLREATAPNIAKSIINFWCCKHGIPYYLRSDRGSNIVMAKVIQEMHNVLQIQPLPTTSYRPCGNSQSERCIYKIIKDGHSESL